MSRLTVLVLVALAFTPLALTTRTGPHRARQSHQPCAFYSCPDPGPNGEALRQTQMTDSNGSQMCTYGETGMDKCLYASASSGTPLSGSDAGCPPGVCSQMPACDPSLYQCAPVTGYFLAEQGPITVAGVGPAEECVYESRSNGASEDFCYYLSANGQLAYGDNNCPSSETCPSTGRRSWEDLVPPKPRSLEELLEAWTGAPVPGLVPSKISSS
ncbi:hypothetical protein CALVIDRAFT_526146 [Calocera viscosa TUFC12733]|uniref:Uncharacterized protein n=1 Tax=Calocera viscosa (strain TUFC12733) TaxID=1330018 RepID=A0A167NZX8_CALVF|nr:hypothetical protein CALVIDRAFT_526146 [Calocera viscosa TUFC12733]